MFDRRYTLREIGQQDPWFDPTEVFGEGWSGTLPDVLDMPINAEARVWTVVSLLPERMAVAAGCILVRDISDLLAYPASIQMLEAAERYARGETPDDSEMDALDDAACEATMFLDSVNYWRIHAANAAYDLSWSVSSAAEWAVMARGYASNLSTAAIQEHQVDLLKQYLGGLNV